MPIGALRSGVLRKCLSPANARRRELRRVRLRQDAMPACLCFRFVTLKRLSRLSGGHLGPCAAGGRLVSDTAPIKIVTAQPDKVDDCS